MKKRFLCLALMLVMLVGIIPLSAVTAFAAEPQSENTPVTYSGDVVNVTTWEELKAALEAEGTATVVVKQDITKKISFAGTKGNEDDYDTFWSYKADCSFINQRGTKTLVLENDINVTVTNPFLREKYFRGILMVQGSLTIEGPGSFLGNSKAYDYEILSEIAHSKDEFFAPVVIYNGKNLVIEGGTIGGNPDISNNLFGAIATSGNTVINGGVVQGVAYDSPYDDYGFQAGVGEWVKRGYFHKYCVLAGYNYIINGGEIKSITKESRTADQRVVGHNYEWMEWFGGAIEESYWKTPTFYRYLANEGKNGVWKSEALPGIVLVVNKEHITINGGKFTTNSPYCQGFGESGEVILDWVQNPHPSYRDYKDPQLYPQVIERMNRLLADGTTLTFNSDYTEFTVQPSTTKATVNGKACADGETVQVPLVGNSVPVTFTWNGLDESLEDCTLIPSIKAYINGTQFAVSYTPEKNPDGTYSVTFNPGIGYGGQTMKYVLDLYVDLPNKCQVVIDSLEVNFAVVNAIVDTANVTVDTPVAGQTPADFVGTENTDGISIVSGTWYEYNGSSLKKMQDGDKFVAGKNYVYGVNLALDKGYSFGEGFKATINGTNAKKNGDYFNWISAVMTSQAVLSAKAQNDVTSATVKYNDYAQFVVDVNGGSGSPTYTWTKSEGAPDIVAGGADNQHYIDVQGTKNGTFTYTCVVKDGAETQTVTFTLIVQEQVTYYAAAPDVNGLVGTGNKDVDLLVGESVTLIPDYVLIENNYEVSGSNLTPRKGTISISWWIFTLDDSTGVHITADQLVVDDDVADYLNTSKTGRYYVQIEITNYVDNSEYGSATRHSELLIIEVVEPEATGNVKGNISSGQNARTFSMRSGGDLEGTIVYLVKDDKIVYATEANAQGYYTFTNVLYGSYNVKVDKEGYEEYNKPVEVNAAEVDHDITIILHVCFADEGMTMHFPATQPTCSDVTEGTLGNIEYRGCIACGKYYDMEGNLIADSANDPGSLNDMGVPYKAIIYPMHDYCGEAQEGGDADRYLRHRADNCLEETTYWYYCIYCHKSAGDDPSALDKYYVGSASNQTHSYTLEIADEYYRYDFHELGENGKENCAQKVWYYHACEYCYEKSPSSVWESSYYGVHDYGDLRAYQPEIHTATELKGAVAAHYFCDICDTYFDEAYIETTLEMLTGAKPEHSYTNVNGYKESDGHANTCSCGAHDTVVPHTPNIENATEDEDKKCTECGYIIQNKLSHTHVLKPVAEVGATCTTDGVKAYYACDCGSHYAEDAEGTKVIENLSEWKLGDGKIAAAHIPNADDGDCTTEITCSVCGEITTPASTHADTDTDGKCDACGKDMPTTPGGDKPGTEPGTEPGTDEPGTDTPGTDEPGTDTPGTDAPNTGNTDEPKDDEGGLGTGAIVAIVVGSVLVVGVGGFALVWFVIKKKTWAEFLAIFKKG